MPWVPASFDVFVNVSLSNFTNAGAVSPGSYLIMSPSASVLLGIFFHSPFLKAHVKQF